MIAVPALRVQEHCGKSTEESSCGDASAGSPLSALQCQEKDVHDKKSHTSGGRRQVFYCSIMPCDYRTDRKNNLKRHIAAMHRASPRAFRCCAQTFSCKAEFRRHTRQVHRESGYTCDQCSLRFDRRALLMRHTSVHSGVKPFTCASCGYATSHKSNLLRHCAKRGHSSENPAFPRSRSSSYGEDCSSDVSSKHSNELSSPYLPVSPSRSEQGRSVVSSTTEEMSEDTPFTSTPALPRPRMSSFKFDFPPTSGAVRQHPVNDVLQRPGSYPKAKQTWAKAYYTQINENGQTTENEKQHNSSLGLLLSPSVEIKTENSDHINNNNNHGWGLPTYHRPELDRSMISDGSKGSLPLRVPALGFKSLNTCEQCSRNSGLFPLQAGQSRITPYERCFSYDEGQSLNSPPFAISKVDNSKSYATFQQPVISHLQRVYNNEPTDSFSAFRDSKYDQQSTGVQLMRSGLVAGDTNGSDSTANSFRYQLHASFHTPYPSYTHHSSNGKIEASPYLSSSTDDDTACNPLLNDKRNYSCCTTAAFHPWASTFGKNGHDDTKLISRELVNGRKNRSPEIGFISTNNSLSQNDHTSSESHQLTSSVSATVTNSKSKDYKNDVDFQQRTEDIRRFPNVVAFQKYSPITNNRSKHSPISENSVSPCTSFNSSASSTISSNGALSSSTTQVHEKKGIWRPIKLRICDTPYKCFECSISFKRQSSYIEHEQTHPHQKQVMRSIVSVMSNVSIEHESKTRMITEKEFQESSDTDSN